MRAEAVPLLQHHTTISIPGKIVRKNNAHSRKLFDEIPRKVLFEIMQWLGGRTLRSNTPYLGRDGNARKYADGMIMYEPMLDENRNAILDENDYATAILLNLWGNTDQHAYPIPNSIIDFNPELVSLLRLILLSKKILWETLRCVLPTSIQDKKLEKFITNLGKEFYKYTPIAHITQTGSPLNGPLISTDAECTISTIHDKKKVSIMYLRGDMTTSKMISTFFSFLNHLITSSFNQEEYQSDEKKFKEFNKKLSKLFNHLPVPPVHCFRLFKPQPCLVTFLAIGWLILFYTQVVAFGIIVGSGSEHGIRAAISIGTSIVISVAVPLYALKKITINCDCVVSKNDLKPATQQRLSELSGWWKNFSKPCQQRSITHISRESAAELKL